ncbi:ficolin-2-like [Ruditapes philippinarum]|uniref:ficolin-2-like n=1 Tax=Ruditapes philippinarum TaxID=129788 RepID=UPI00295B9BE7|nr:ficolin-2-like [Ruditapes philippinarum]
MNAARFVSSNTAASLAHSNRTVMNVLDARSLGVVSDCKEILDVYPEAESGFYEIELWESKKKLIVNCDMKTDGGGWTIFHRRFDGSIDFYQNFTEYENGFGNAGGELWLGLKYIQELADQDHSEVRIDLTKTTQDNLEAELAYNNKAPFSTFDRDLDSAPPRSCAVDRHGGWWYYSCTFMNINGLYVRPGTICEVAGAETRHCGHLHGGFESGDMLRRSSMILRRT